MRARTRTRSMPARAAEAVLTALSAMLVVILLPTLVTPAHAWDDRSITVSATRLQVGAEVEVAGGGFPAGETVDIKVCGVPDANGVLSCKPVLTGVTVAVNGTVSETVTVEEPSGPCPCSVAITAMNAPPVATRIELLGHEMASQAQAPELIVDNAELVGGNLLGFFGAPATRTLELTLRNAGVAPAGPTLQLSWSEGDGEPVAITDPEVPQIAPGQTETVRVPVDLAGFSQGSYEVSGHAVVGDLYANVNATTKIVPWGLYGLGLLLLAGVVVFRVRVADVGPGEPREQRSASRRSGAERHGPAPVAASVAGDRSLEEAAELAIARATRSAPQTVETPLVGGRTAVPAAAHSDEELLGPPRLEATPIMRREGFEDLRDTRFPVAPPPPLAPPTGPIPPAPSLDAAAYMQAYLEATGPQAGPLAASLGAAAASAPAQPAWPPVPPSAPPPETQAQHAWGQNALSQGVFPDAEEDPLARVWAKAEPIVEVAPPPLEVPSLEDPPATPPRGISIAERLAQSAEAVGISDEEYASGPRAAGIPFVGNQTAADGADIVARALETIKEHSGDNPLRLPDRDEYVVPEQRDRRASRGGRRADRSDRPGDKWLTRR